MNEVFLEKQLHLCAAKMDDQVVLKLHHPASLQGTIHYSTNRFFFSTVAYPIRSHYLRLTQFLESHVMWTVLGFTVCSVDRMSRLYI